MSDDPLAIEVQNVSSQPGIPAEETLTAWLRAALGGALRGEVTLRIVGDAESAELNARYRRKPGPTNVLAFPAAAAAPGGAGGTPLDGEPPPAGDVVVCAPVVAREAAEQGKASDAHWAHIVVHGGLHLAGYDHEAPADAERMEARERELLAGFGFPDPYA